ncbi:MAG: tetratricopeptide repeat protein [Deltaproteobacteria bacterium]|nr:tetratricopeptide repeat protein [Deltaproteobacteria bacterium]
MKKENLPMVIKNNLTLFMTILIGSIFVSCAGIEKAKYPEHPPTIQLPDTGPSPEIKVGKKIAEEQRDPRHEAYTDFTFASLCMRRGEYEKAGEYLENAINNDPDSIYLKKIAALNLQRLKRFDAAAEYARSIITQDPDDLGAHMILAEALAASGDENSAIRIYEGILEKNPDQQRVRMILATSLIREIKYEAALEHLDILIQQNPELAIAHYYRGRINVELERYNEAEKDFLNTVELESNIEEQAFFDLARLYFIQKKFEMAASTYEKLLSLYPGNMVAKERLINVYYKLGEEKKIEHIIQDIKKQSGPGDLERQALGIIYLRHGKLDESIEELEMIVSAWPDDQKSRYYLALAYEERGDLEKALYHFDLIKEDSEFYPNALIQTAYILNQMERDEAAIEILQKALKYGEQEIALYLMLSSIYETREEYDKSIQVIEEGLTVHEQNVDLMFRLGVVLDKSGEKEKALEEMRRLLTIDENNADALNYIGYTYAEMGIRLGEALELIRKALAIKPDSGYIIDSLGWVYYQKGLYDEALDSLERAFSIISSDPTIAEHLGDVYFKKGAYRKSLDMYLKAIELKSNNEDELKEKIKEVERFLE